MWKVVYQKVHIFKSAYLFENIYSSDEYAGQIKLNFFYVIILCRVAVAFIYLIIPALLNDLFPCKTTCCLLLKHTIFFPADSELLLSYRYTDALYYIAAL